MHSNRGLTDSYITFVSLALEKLGVNHELKWVSVPVQGWEVGLLDEKFARRRFHWCRVTGWSYRSPQSVEEMWIRRGPGEDLISVDEIAAQILQVATNPKVAWSYQVVMASATTKGAR